jgi:ABC-2 type transport system ATP-binding protein
MADDIAIKVEHVSKNFVLPHERANSVKSLFTSLNKKQDKSAEIQHALKGINFEVKKGEFFGIVGRNGSGKSTLLKILAGIYQPTSGRVHTQGKLVPFIELGVGFNPELTGRENVYLNGAMLGFSEKEVDAMYADIVQFAELERFMDQKLKNYSSGMQVRLAFSMATRSEADILLVDEVLAVGDADFQRKCFNYFKELKAKHKTVVFVTHDMGAVREYCDRAMMIEQSQMVHIGSADEIATEYVKLFNRPTTSGVKAVEGKDRWGDGIVQFDTIKTEVTDKEVVVEMDAKAQGESVDPVFGYLIKDSAGNDLIGSNTKINKVTIGTVHRGDRLTVRWHLPNIFNDGVFLLTAAISHNDGVTQHDWWNTAASFTVFREDKTPYALNPQANIELERG